jgi:N-glycosylase/DNA lyase
MITFKNRNFSAEQIARSGQCFRMDKTADGRYAVIARDKHVLVSQSGDEITFECTENEFEEFWRRYFDLDTDYGKFISAIDKSDGYLTAAAEAGSGIRILNQDLWEMTVSFIISQQNNIPRIKKCISNICMTYGEPMTAPDGTRYYSFPKPGALARLEEDALMECNLGYRSKYVVRTAKDVEQGRFRLEDLYGMDYETARRELLKLYGVGGKVADCICLFALHKIDAFPVDTHIRQVLSEHYSTGFPFERYSGFAGVLQQYIFYYDLIKAGKQT